LYAYDPYGKCLVKSREVNRLVKVTLDPSQYKMGPKKDKRKPELYKKLIEIDE